ncbi:MAM domain-containing glycosylphosphatidylinositol anchor protein 2 [Goodea atripinnis]|uniref:MAM domain-containing glycosylphosphatidylinositol anchor protein 2 n=1 Tax=Goodea atripinnis TaxID=208336 RepID=A0ABV0NGV8_9TELE
MVITQTDPDISPGTTNLDIIDLKFTDFGTYTCVAALKGGGIPEISIDVNISSTTEEITLKICQGFVLGMRLKLTGSLGIGSRFLIPNQGSGLTMANKNIKGHRFL